MNSENVTLTSGPVGENRLCLSSSFAKHLRMLLPKWEDSAKNNLEIAWLNFHWINRKMPGVAWWVTLRIVFFCRKKSSPAFSLLQNKHWYKKKSRKKNWNHNLFKLIEHCGLLFFSLFSYVFKTKITINNVIAQFSWWY